MWEPHWVDNPVINPGWNRSDAPLISTPPPSNFFGIQRFGDDNPWTTLEWWESSLQAARGITLLAKRPFIHLVQRETGEQLFTPTRMLYPYALRGRQKKRIALAAGRIAALVRQARETYMAAEAVGVSDLTRPILYFYGAVALAEAATVALFGTDRLERNHGLSAKLDTADGDDANIITWEPRGTFPMFYRATRWDSIFSNEVSDAKRWKEDTAHQELHFHALECIRVLRYPWGLLDTASNSMQTPFPHNVEPRGNCLLPYRQGEDMYLKPTTPLDRPVVQVPRVIVQYMLLYFFSMLARYETPRWQMLLEGRTNKMGYVYRAAVERVAYDFVRDMVPLFPLQELPQSSSAQAWCEYPPSLEEWYERPRELVNAPEANYSLRPPLDEWDR